MNILVPSLPARFRISAQMTEDLLYDPVMGFWIFFGMELDAFQAAAVRYMWFSRLTEDHSGHGSSKTFRGWGLTQLSCILIPGCVVGVVFQNFQSAKDNYWKYYESSYMTPLFRAQLGKFVDDGEGQKGKSSSREPGSWKRYFKSGARIEMPAPGHIGDAEKLGSWEVHRMLVDEANKIRKMGAGIQKQLMGRVRLQPYSRQHPVWQNKMWLLGTAETVDHPSYTAHAGYEREITKGNPKICTVSFCYKDWSNLTFKHGRNRGRAFRDIVPDMEQIEMMKKDNTPEGWLGEGLGIWAMNVRRWYSDEAILAAQALGRSRGLIPVASRLQDPLGSEAYYFCGVDPSRAKNTNNDDGTIVVLRALPRVENPGTNEAEYDVDPVFAQKIRNYDASAWASVLHELQMDFGFALMLIDPLGGGDFIIPELRKPRARINGIEQDVTPIVTREDVTAEVSFPILHCVLRSDPGIRKLWPQLANARGSDVLKFYVNSALRTALEKGFMSLMPPNHERDRELVKTWLPRQQWSSILLSDVTKKQLESFGAKMDEKGQWKLTANGVPSFTSKTRDDFHDGLRNAWVAFRIWLMERDEDWSLGKGRKKLCGGFSRGASQRASLTQQAMSVSPQTAALMGRPAKGLLPG